MGGWGGGVMGLSAGPISGCYEHPSAWNFQCAGVHQLGPPSGTKFYDPCNRDSKKAHFFGNHVGPFWVCCYHFGWDIWYMPMRNYVGRCR